MKKWFTKSTYHINNVLQFKKETENNPNTELVLQIKFLERCKKYFVALFKNKHN